MYEGMFMKTANDKIACLKVGKIPNIRSLLTQLMIFIRNEYIIHKIMLLRCIFINLNVIFIRL